MMNNEERLERHRKALAKYRPHSYMHRMIQGEIKRLEKAIEADGQSRGTRSSSDSGGEGRLPKDGRHSGQQWPEDRLDKIADAAARQDSAGSASPTGRIVYPEPPA